jgi:uncharacterized Zn finger protein (UPF0148 family)
VGQPWTILWTGAPLRHIHGEYPDYELGCPKCRDAAERDEERARENAERDEERARESERRADERAEELARELAESAEEAAYKQANPGDYECPSCLYITLRKGAVACPKCQRDVPPQYWLDVRTKEEAKAREEARRQAAAAEEWKRTEPQRRAAASAAAAAAAEQWKRAESQRRAAADAKIAAYETARLLKYLHLVWAVPAGFFFGGIAGTIAGQIIGAILPNSTAKLAEKSEFLLGVLGESSSLFGQ